MRRNHRAFIVVLFSTLVLLGCATPPSAAHDDAATQTSPEASAPLFADFTSGKPDTFYTADGYGNGKEFNVTWRNDNVRFEDGVMKLVIDNDSAPQDGVPYSGGEFRSNDLYGYGRYEVMMKAMRNEGVVSSFFTYTDEWDNHPWDEIDVEILGKDPTKVQFNYFTSGVGNHEYLYDLGFDASAGFHTYAFEWREDSITWYVDGKEAYRAEENIPSNPGRIMMNAWCGRGVDEWLNAFDDSSLPLAAEYAWVRYYPY